MAPMNKHSGRWRWGAVATAGLLVLSACGGGSTAKLSQDYCGKVAGFADSTPNTDGKAADEVKALYASFLSENRATLDLLAKDAPKGEAKDGFTAMNAGITKAQQTGQEDLPTLTSAYGKLVSGSASGCSWKKQTIAAADYKFTNAPTKLAKGSYAFVIDNTGKEEHMMAVVRVKDGVTKSLDQLLSEGKDGPPPDVEEVGTAFAAPGMKGAGVMKLDRPGRYAFVCPIPTKDGQPHFMMGMKGEFTVA